MELERYHQNSQLLLGVHQIHCLLLQLFQVRTNLDYVVLDDHLSIPNLSVFCPINTFLECFPTVWTLQYCSNLAIVFEVYTFQSTSLESGKGFIWYKSNFT